MSKKYKVRRTYKPRRHHVRLIAVAGELEYVRPYVYRYGEEGSWKVKVPHTKVKRFVFGPDGTEAEERAQFHAAIRHADTIDPGNSVNSLLGSGAVVRKIIEMEAATTDL